MCRNRRGEKINFFWYQIMFFSYLNALLICLLKSRKMIHFATFSHFDSIRGSSQRLKRIAKFVFRQVFPKNLRWLVSRFLDSILQFNWSCHWCWKRITSLFLGNLSLYVDSDTTQTVSKISFGIPWSAKIFWDNRQLSANSLWQKFL